MSKRQEKLFIINRSFWPVYPVIGEALMRFAEQEAKTGFVGVILQSHTNIHEQLQLHARGQGVRFFPAKAWSVSGSSILRRILDAGIFMCWVLMVLLWQRPSRVYVSTDPPVLVPFAVMIYCKLFGAKYIYHLQDIHPEATNVVVPVNLAVFKFFRWLDSVSMRKANFLLTITEEMAHEIRQRSATQAPIRLLANPSVPFDGVAAIRKKNGFTFCGNAGRLQRIPLLIDVITVYCDRGGKLPFVFAGAGVYANALAGLAGKYANVTYKGLVSPAEAARLSAEYQWALLPIEDEVTRFAFPSKSSSYVYSGAFIAAVCGEQTSVSHWVSQHRLGVTIAPEREALVDFFFAVEKADVDTTSLDVQREQLKSALGFDVFVKQLTEVSDCIDA